MRADGTTRIGSSAEFRRLIVRLGIAMVAAGDAVDVIEESLRRVVAAYGVAGLQVALLPTSLFVQTGTGDRAHVQFSSQVAPPLRLDQIDGQMVSGASRLVNGFVQLALLAFGIVAAGALLRASPAELTDHRVAGLGTWAGWVAVAVFALGVCLHFSAPLRSLPWMLLVLYVAFAGQAIGDALFGGQISGFFGAAAMTPVVLWVERLANGPPKLVTFLPAFWLLVPGATGLIGVAQIVGTGSGVTARGLSDVLITIISISLGVLIGTAAYRAADAGLRRLSGDHSAAAPGDSKPGATGQRQV